MHKAIKDLFITCSTYKKYMMMFVADAQWMQSCWDIPTDSQLFGSDGNCEIRLVAEFHTCLVKTPFCLVGLQKQQHIRKKLWPKIKIQNANNVFSPLKCVSKFVVNASITQKMFLCKKNEWLNTW